MAVEVAPSLQLETIIEKRGDRIALTAIAAG
jgi:hypothetical protein